MSSSPSSPSTWSAAFTLFWMVAGWVFGIALASPGTPTWAAAFMPIYAWVVCAEWLIKLMG